MSVQLATFMQHVNKVEEKVFVSAITDLWAMEEPIVKVRCLFTKCIETL